MNLPFGYKLEKRNPDTKVWASAKHRIVYAFTIGGVDYYQYEDAFNIPCMRGLYAVVFYEEMRMRVSREYLEADLTGRKAIHAKIDDLFKVTNSKFDIIAVHKQIQELRLADQRIEERLKMILEETTSLKLASVVYFDKTENPNLFEEAYARKKIAMWKENQPMADFFLQKPIRELIPFLDLSKENLETYLTVNRQVVNQHLEKVLSLLSEKDLMTESVKKLLLESGYHKASPSKA